MGWPIIDKYFMCVKHYIMLILNHRIHNVYTKNGGHREMHIFTSLSVFPWWTVCVCVCGGGIKGCCRAWTQTPLIDCTVKSYFELCSSIRIQKRCRSGCFQRVELRSPSRKPDWQLINGVIWQITSKGNIKEKKKCEELRVESVLLPEFHFAQVSALLLEYRVWIL